jgi:hypothetical protein
MKTKHTLGALAFSAALAVRVASAASSDFWIPYAATPVSGTPGGKSGLFLIASNAVGGSTAPAPAWITESEPTLLGTSFQGFVTGSAAPAAATPMAMIYAAKGADGNQHLYGLDLANPTGSAAAPEPVQITSLSVPASKSVCAAGQLETQLTAPATLEVVVYVATPEPGSHPGTTGYCSGAPDGKYYLATYGESAKTGPTEIDIPGGTSTFSALANDGNFNALYLNNGDLGGLLYWDSVTKDENLYIHPNFTGPTTLLGGIAGEPIACVNVPAVTNGAKDNLDGALATVNTSAGFKSYQFVASGEVFEFFDGQAAGCITDPDHLYFIGTRNGSTASSLYEESLTSITTPKTLLEAFTSTPTESYSLIGSNGSVVIFQKNSVSSTGLSTTLQTVPVGVTSSKATSIGGPYSGAVIQSFLAPAAGGSSSDPDWLFVVNLNEGSPLTGMSYTSEILNPNGSGIIMRLPPDTVIESFGVFSTELDGNVLEIAGITDTDGGFGGATLALLAVGKVAPPSKVNLTGGSPYKVPAGYEMSVGGFYGTSVAGGALFSLKGAPSIGVALDVSKHVIVQFSLPETNVAPLL